MLRSTVSLVPRAMAGVACLAGVIVLSGCGSDASVTELRDAGEAFLTAIVIEGSVPMALAVSDASLEGSIRSTVADFEDAGFRFTGPVEIGSCKGFFESSATGDCVRVAIRGCPKREEDGRLFVRLGSVFARVSADAPARVVYFEFEGGFEVAHPGSPQFERLAEERKDCAG